MNGPAKPRRPATLAGERVRHYKYGVGVVRELSSRGIAVVQFPHGVEYVVGDNLEVERNVVPRAPAGERTRGAEERERKAAEATAEARRQKKAREDHRATVLQRLNAGAYPMADALYEKECAAWWDRDAYEQCKQESKLRIQAETRARRREKVMRHLRAFEFDIAESVYTKRCADWWDRIDYTRHRQTWKRVGAIVSSYVSCSLLDLDGAWERMPGAVITGSEMAVIKQRKLDLRLAGVGMSLDHDQRLACARPEKHLLIKARAGSGKTRTLAAIAALAIRDQQLNPDQVMILAFNKKAASEVRKRVRHTAGIPEYRNARTFHGLAYRLAGDTGRNLVYDQAEAGPVGCTQLQVVEQALRGLLNPAFRGSLYDFFRRELTEVEQLGLDLPKNAYFAFRRALVLVTLSGQYVKSNGEKFIADFLFEHDITFKYEKVHSWQRADLIQGAAYRPDFSITANGRDYILEHWAIDPDQPGDCVPSWWENTDTNGYRRLIQDKRRWCKARNITLLETHTGMLRYGRDAFEQALATLLGSAGIRCRLLPHDVLVQRVMESPHRISRMAKLFQQFIQRAKKRGWSVEVAADAIRTAPDEEPRNRVFHDLALRVYAEYERLLIAQGRLDFDDLLVLATDNIKRHGDSLSFDTDNDHEHSVALSDLRWILLDEYQDFSELYCRMLSAILHVNPDIRIVAVGDDWQAINGFAGAQPIFFRDFAEYFKGGGMAQIAMNYRSAPQIVEAGNQLMCGLGEPGRAGRSTAGEISTRDIDDLFVEFRPGPDQADAQRDDAIYFAGTPYAADPPPQSAPSQQTLNAARSLKACSEFIIKSWARVSPTDGGGATLEPEPRSVLCLSRIGTAYGISLNDFRQRLCQVLADRLSMSGKEVEAYVDVLTAHRSKGKEADTVIILEATRKRFPLMHADDQLFGPFGVTLDDVLAEERRLFYVAATRAERRMLLLSERDAHSPYIEEMGLGLVSGSEAVADHRGIRRPRAEPELGEVATVVQRAIKQLDAWELRRDNLSPCLRPLLVALADANFSEPKIGYSVKGGDGELFAELAWIDEKIAVLTGAQLGYVDEWHRRGWYVVKPNAQPDVTLNELHRRLHPAAGS